MTLRELLMLLVESHGRLSDQNCKTQVTFPIFPIKGW